MNTMGQILRNWRIAAAGFFSLALVIGAYVLARGVSAPPIAEASTETALLQAVATRDTDGDGLPDWEEALYGTSPTKVDSFSLGMSDGEAVAKGLIVPKAIADVPVATSTPEGGADGLPPAPAEGTLTNAFAKSFFTLYLAEKQKVGGDLNESQVNDVANQAISSLAATVSTAPDYKQASDLLVSGSGADAMKAFAASAEAIFLQNTADASGTPLDYLKKIIQENDSTATTHLAAIAKVYRDGATGLAALPVPREVASADLELINALMRMSQITSDFAAVDTDPLATILALQQYPDVGQLLATAFAHVAQAYAAKGVVISVGSPGASLVTAPFGSNTSQSVKP